LIPWASDPGESALFCAQAEEGAFFCFYGAIMKHNAAESQDVAAREKEAELLRLQELGDVQTLLRTAAGRRFFSRMFEIGGLFRSTFTGNSQGMFNEGHRSFALRFFKDVVEAAPERVQELIVKTITEETE